MKIVHTILGRIESIDINHSEKKNGEYKYFTLHTLCMYLFFMFREKSSINTQGKKTISQESLNISISNT